MAASRVPIGVSSSSSGASLPIAEGVVIFIKVALTFVALENYLIWVLNAVRRFATMDPARGIHFDVRVGPTVNARRPAVIIQVRADVVLPPLIYVWVVGDGILVVEVDSIRPRLSL
jgi:hypothetical protein